MVLIAGCTNQALDSDVAARLSRSESGDRAQATVGTVYCPDPEHDFGPILARGQFLQHDFLLKNPTDRPIRLLKATALTPCCSALDSPPESIPPHGDVRISTRLKAGLKTGSKVAKFAVETDDPRAPLITLALGAQFHAEWELSGASFAPIISLGTPHSIKLLVLSRRKEGEGRGAPDTVTATPPLQAGFAGPPEERRRDGGIIESTRAVEVHLPASSEPGAKSGAVEFRWTDGGRRVYAINWGVRPRLRVTPAGLVLRASEGRVSKTVTIRSADRPFRITSVEGTVLTDRPGDFTAAPALSHTIRLGIDAAKAAQSPASDIRIGTDDPSQPEVLLSIMVLPEREGGVR